MAIDTATYVGNLDPSIPEYDDQKHEGDDNMRATKNAIVNSFGNITGAVTATHIELSLLAGKTALGDASGDDIVTIAHGGTGGATASSARTNLGLVKGSSIGNVVVVSDVNGVPGLPSLDGSLLTGIVTSPAVPGDVDVTTFKYAEDYLYFYGQL